MSSFSLLTLFVSALGAWLFQRRLARLRAPCGEPLRGQARVSIVIPARNEQHNLPILLRSLQQLTLRPHEVIVVDDHSHDATAQIARDLGARVIVPGPMVERFIGKTWACQCGADAATGDHLLFTDADTFHAPDSLARSLAALQRTDASMLSVVPTHRCVQLWERLQGVFQLLLLIATRAGAEQQHYANGQYLLFRRDRYDALTGHRAVSPYIAEDLAFVRAVRKAGERVHVLFAPGQLLVRMYPEGFAAFFAGWRRNFREGMRSGGARTALEMTLVMALLVGAPLCGLLELRDGHTGSALLWAGVYLLNAGLVAREQRHYGAFGAASALLYPLFTLVFALVSLRSALDALRGSPIQWRGRSIAAVR